MIAGAVSTLDRAAHIAALAATLHARPAGRIDGGSAKSRASLTDNSP
jgi:hypothetical protein